MLPAQWIARPWQDPLLLAKSQHKRPTPIFEGNPPEGIYQGRWWQQVPEGKSLTLACYILKVVPDLMAGGSRVVGEGLMLTLLWPEIVPRDR